MSTKREYTNNTYLLLANVVVDNNIAYRNAGKTINQIVTSPLNNGVITSSKRCPQKETAERAVIWLAMSRDLYLAEKMANSVDLFTKFDGK